MNKQTSYWQRGCLLVAALAAASALAQNGSQVQLLKVGSGFERPTSITNAADGSGRLFVVEQGGLVKVLRGTQVEAQPFLDVRSLTRAGGERGLLGLAFDPKFSQNGRLFVDYTNLNGDTVIARYTAVSGKVSPASAKVLLTIKQPYSNHNGGQLAFGPDGFLYIGMGDGGSGGDPQNNAQNLGSLLGKLLRLDVRGGSYTVPKDNPFVNTAGARGEIFAYGLRNPWRFSFSSAGLLIADVGQNKYEEINFLPKGSAGGENYGWRLKEAAACYQPASNCNSAKTKLQDPILSYDHTQGNSVTGGYVYRGQVLPALRGQYIYGDFGSGTIWAAAPSGAKWKTNKVLDTELSIATFGESEAGELYLADYGSGTVYQFVAK
ncbi:PQQ-dependent sugar dehydrogenase [Deinococcus detaillensis]|uniref:PQQ-dependent sugar dehydrogenase n=1 Tax=Deinococcus detaillensis TaxID=2592048 RepID=A0A553V530_9DEIO|nr:PQQ-dependent sugar dehydrogenase [Deinococcus detaillensis]TSA87566.1 PQQ-dependent sugar dehydrogenase [Deinococcus detaillensis]